MSVRLGHDMHIFLNTDNAAFDGDMAGEVGRIMATVVHAIEAGSTWGTMRDTNGNTVGAFDLSDEPCDLEHLGDIIGTRYVTMGEVLANWPEAARRTTEGHRPEGGEGFEDTDYWADYDWYRR